MQFIYCLYKNVHGHVYPPWFLYNYFMSCLQLPLEWSTAAQLLANCLAGLNHYFQICARNTVVQRFAPHGNVKSSLLHSGSDHQPGALLGSLHHHSFLENNAIHQVFLELSHVLNLESYEYSIALSRSPSLSGWHQKSITKDHSFKFIIRVENISHRDL